MKSLEIRELTDSELRDRLVTERERLTRLKLNHSVSPLDNPLQIRFARKDIARMCTELRRRQLTAAPAKEVQ